MLEVLMGILGKKRMMIRMKWKRYLSKDGTCRFLVYDFDNHEKGAENNDGISGMFIHARLVIKMIIAHGCLLPTDIWHHQANQFSYATNVKKAESEANHVICLLKDKSIDYPVFYDLEDSRTVGMCDESTIGDMAEMFCHAIEAAGYKVGIYANKYWFTRILTDERFDKWDKGVAQYNEKCTYKGEYIGWQYSSTGAVDGIKGNVDLNKFYVDYSSK